MSGGLFDLLGKVMLQREVSDRALARAVHNATAEELQDIMRPVLITLMRDVSGDVFPYPLTLETLAARDDFDPNAVPAQHVYPTTTWKLPVVIAASKPQNFGALRALFDAFGDRIHINGTTALRDAVKARNIEGVRLLRLYGANVRQRDVSGKRPVDYVVGTADEVAEMRLALEPRDERNAWMQAVVFRTRYNDDEEDRSSKMLRTSGGGGGGGSGGMGGKRRRKRSSKRSGKRSAKRSAKRFGKRSRSRSARRRIRRY